MDYEIANIPYLRFGKSRGGVYRGGNSPTPSLLSVYAADGTSSPSVVITTGGSSVIPSASCSA
jgi:hypothetical protein